MAKLKMAKMIHLHMCKLSVIWYGKCGDGIAFPALEQISYSCVGVYFIISDFFYDGKT